MTAQLDSVTHEVILIAIQTYGTEKSRKYRGQRLGISHAHPSPITVTTEAGMKIVRKCLPPINTLEISSAQAAASSSPMQTHDYSVR